MANLMNRSLLSLMSSTLRKPWWIALLIWAAAIAPAHAKSVSLRVAIEQGVPQINVGSSENAQVLDATEQVALGEIQKMNGFAAQAKDGKVALDKWQSAALTIVPKAGGVVWIGDRWYRGTVRLIATGKGLTVVNTVDLEQYLLSVLGAEMNGNWPQEALKAQAVAARSYAIYKRDGAIRSGQFFDLNDTTASQVYQGIQTESNGTLQAVSATAGQVLVYNGSVVEAYFHSSAGNCTEGSENVWSSALPYFKSRQVGFDDGTPVSEWTKTLSISEISSRFKVGNVQRIEPVTLTSVCGRVKQMRVIGDRGSTIVTGEDIQSDFNLRSTLFTIAAQPVPSKSGGKATMQFVINGRGFGHGVGMSQWGAYNMARKGMKYNEILPQYYVGAGITTIDPQ